jgi:hypothetical protein
MKPKEKAQDLWVKCYERLPDSIYSNYAAKMEAKYFALIAVDEMISVLIDLNGIYNITPALTYWQDVKQEIEKL